MSGYFAFSFFFVFFFFFGLVLTEFDQQKQLQWHSYELFMVTKEKGYWLRPIACKKSKLTLEGSRLHSSLGKSRSIDVLSTKGATRTRCKSTNDSHYYFLRIPFKKKKKKETKFRIIKLSFETQYAY